MPTQIHNPRQSSRERYFARQATYRLADKSKLVEVVTAPWLGWVPDLPPHLVGWRGCYAGRGLMPYAYPERGLVLRDDDGYERVDEDRQVGGTSALPNWDARAITMIHQYTDGTSPPDVHRVVIVAGDEAGEDCHMFQVDGTGLWTEIDPDPWIVALGPPDAIPEADRDCLWDAAVFPFGCPNRTDEAGNPASITEPVLVMAGADEHGPVHPVLITPNDVDDTEYDELQPDGTGPTPAPDFMATSCESFDGRMHFLATSEGGNSYPQRHRWTAVGNAFPQDTGANFIGSGYLDLAEFSRRGLRIESLGNKLVLYFEDGVVFQVPTGLYTDAYHPQVVSRTRSLIGTHALCAISPTLQFGIFDDGWYFLDSSGRWSEAGTLVLEETKGKSYELTKWKETFYDLLNQDLKHRTVCEYDTYRKTVRIAFPSTTTSGDNTSILNYHWPTDTCWQDAYTGGVSMWGHFDQQVEAGTAWGTPVPVGMGPTLTWANVTGTWADYAPRYIDEVIIHGSAAGLVFNRNPGLDTYDNIPISCAYLSHTQSRTSDPAKGQTFHRLGLEYVNVGGPSVQLTAVTDGTFPGGVQVQNVNANEGRMGSLQTAYGHFRLHGSHHAVWLFVNAPVAIRSFTPELLIYGLDDRSGQV